MEEPVYRGLGRCVCCFWLAVAFDVVGLLVLLVGVFASVFFYDLLIYAGAIVIFLSLIWWVFWYSGNIEVPPAELEDDVGLLKEKKKDDPGPLRGISGAVRRLSSRVSSGIRSSLRRNGSVGGGGGGGGTGGGGTRTRAQKSAAAAEAPNQQQVNVAMTTRLPQESGDPDPDPAVPSVESCEVEMPHTTTESSPA